MSTTKLSSVLVALLACLLVAVALPATTTFYIYKDSEGKVQVGNDPPPAKRDLSIQDRGTKDVSSQILNALHWHLSDPDIQDFCRDWLSKPQYAATSTQVVGTKTSTKVVTTQSVKTSTKNLGTTTIPSTVIDRQSSFTTVSTATSVYTSTSIAVSSSPTTFTSTVVLPARRDMRRPWWLQDYDKADITKVCQATFQPKTTVVRQTTTTTATRTSTQLSTTTTTPAQSTVISTVHSTSVTVIPVTKTETSTTVTVSATTSAYPVPVLKCPQGVGINGASTNAAYEEAPAASADACCLRCYNRVGCTAWFVFGTTDCYNLFDSAAGTSTDAQCPNGRGRSYLYVSNQASTESDVGGAGPCSGGVQYV